MDDRSIFFLIPRSILFAASKDVVKRATEEIGSKRVWFDLIASLSIGVVACKE